MEVPRDKIYIALFSALTLLLIASFHVIRHTPALNFTILHKNSQDPLSIPLTQSQPIDYIPNIVHYVWAIEERPVFRLDFSVFLSIYSSYLYFRPTQIYIHTDASLDQWAEALACDDDWTRRTLAIPSITYNHIVVPRFSNAGVPINDIRHRTDFVRPPILHEFGGIYMDTDVYALHDIRPLRESGFANVFGLEGIERINNGIMMSKPGSALMKLFNETQHVAFDNTWTAHSVTLLTELCYRLRHVPNEVLIVDKRAFSPSDWLADSMVHLFGEQDDIPPEPKEKDSSMPMTMQQIEDLWDTRGQGDAWEDDYSGYLLHAFDGPDGHWSQQVSLEYVLRRRSNLARAVWPAIHDAMKEGIIVLEEEGKEGQEGEDQPEEER